MTNEQWHAFAAFRDAFRSRCEAWERDAGGPTGWLAALQREAAERDGTPAYPLQTPIVYNRALDDVGREGIVSLIVVGDNPGKDEQLEKNRRYLVGQAGKLGDGFFRRNPGLGVDFRKNVIILNKTPIHSAKTKQLAFLRREGGERFDALFDGSQRWMARETAALQKALGCGLWLVGYGELREKGLFASYAQELGREYAGAVGAANGEAGTRDDVRLYQHFSMNRFTIDLGERGNPSLSLGENLRVIGLAHRAEILGW